MADKPTQAPVAEAPGANPEKKIEPTREKAAETGATNSIYDEVHKTRDEQKDAKDGTKPAGSQNNDGVAGPDDRTESALAANMTPEQRAAAGLDPVDGKPLDVLTEGANGQQLDMSHKVLGMDLQMQDIDGDGKPDFVGKPLTADDTEAAAQGIKGVEGAKGPKGEKGEAGEEGEKVEGEGVVVGDGKDNTKKDPKGDPATAVENENLPKKPADQNQVVLNTDGDQVMADGTTKKVEKAKTDVGTGAVDADAASGGPGPAGPPSGLNATRPVAEKAPAKPAPETDAPSTPAAPTDSAESAALKAKPEAPKTPEQIRIAEANKVLDDAFKNDPNRKQMETDRATFLARTDITDKQKADTLEKFAQTTKGELDPSNKYRSGMSQENVLKAVAGGMNDVAMPRAIDQGDNGTCNATTIQEGLAFGDPAKYADHLKEAALHGTYTGDDNFRAIIPSSMLKPHESASGAQNIDNVRNFSSQLMQGGMLNHLHQQGKGGEVKNPDGSVKYPAGTKQYYTDSDAGGEQRYLFNADALKPGGTGNPFRDDAGRPTAFVESGAGVGVNQEGFMGRNAGIKGQFLLAQANFLDANERANLDPSVKLVGSAEELTAAKAARARDFGGESGKAGTWSVAVVNANNGLFRGGEGQGGAGGGHVVSTYFDAANPGKGDLSNQWGKQFDRKGVSDVALFNAMDYNNRSSAGDRGTPAEGKYDDNTLPQRFRQHEETTPNAHRDGVRRGDEPGPGDRRQEDKDKAKEKEQEKKGEGDGKDGDRKKAEIDRSRLQGQKNQLAAHKAALQGALDRGVEGTAALFANADASLKYIDTELQHIQSA